MLASDQGPQPGLVELHAPRQAGARHVDCVGERDRDQRHRRLDVQGPDTGAWQNVVEQVDPGPVGRFGRDAQPAQECSDRRCHQQPVQDHRAVVGLATFHQRLPASWRCRASTPVRRIDVAHAPNGRWPDSLACGLATRCGKPLLRLYKYLSPKIAGSPEAAMQTSLLVIRHAAKACPDSTPQADVDNSPIGRVMARDWLIPRLCVRSCCQLCRSRSAALLFPVFHCAASSSPKAGTGRCHRPNGMKVYLASWRHSAHTATNT